MRAYPTESCSQMQIANKEKYTYSIPQKQNAIGVLTFND